MKKALLSWLYSRFRDRPAGSFTPELAANGLNQPVDLVLKNLQELQDTGVIKTTSKNKHNSFRLTDIGLMTARRIFESG